MSAPLFVESELTSFPPLQDTVARALASQVPRAPGLSTLSAAAQSQALGGIVYACRAFLAERALQAGTRSADVLERLSLAQQSAAALTKAVESLDGVAWGHLMRGLREGEAGVRLAGKLEGVPDLLAYLKGLQEALARAVEAAREGPAAHPDQARLLIAARVGVGLEKAGISLVTKSPGTFDYCARAAFSAVGLEPPGEIESLLERAITVVRRHGGQT